MPHLIVHKAGPCITVQDLGRPGWTARGLSRGGAADRLAALEIAALLGGDTQTAVLEMMGFGGTFAVTAPTRIALTGATMTASIDGIPLQANTTARLMPDQKLTIGGAKEGVFGYLGVAGGILTDATMDSRATHLTAAIGRVLQAGDRLPIGDDPEPEKGPTTLAVAPRLAGGSIRIMAGPQTDFFAKETQTAFTTTSFTRSPRGNRQGIKLDYEGEGFPTAGGLTLVSDLIVPGDIQIAGGGVPYILLSECQTIGGYPRIGTVIPADLPKIAQAGPGTALSFAFIDLDTADATALSDADLLRQLSQSCTPLIRDPHDIPDLGGYQLISGTTRGDDLER